VAAFFRVELLRRAVMELLLPRATAAWAAAAAKQRRHAGAAPGRSDATPAVTGSASGSRPQ
jgi:hypothetical protein